MLPRTGPSGRTESERAAHSRGAVDIAMISAMRDAPLQGNEAVALTWGDVEFVQDGSARLTIRPTVPTSASEAAILSVGRGAATALNAIRGDATDTDPVFRLKSVKALGNRIRAAAKRLASKVSMVPRRHESASSRISRRPDCPTLRSDGKPG